MSGQEVDGRHEHEEKQELWPAPEEVGESTAHAAAAGQDGGRRIGLDGGDGHGATGC